MADETDYRAMLREAKDEAGKAHAVSMISAQRLAKSAHRNLEGVFKALFK
ncbi:hypothetical protein [Cupriavidus sp. CP313]